MFTLYPLPNNYNTAKSIIYYLALLNGFANVAVAGRIAGMQRNIILLITTGTTTKLMFLTDKSIKK